MLKTRVTELFGIERPILSAPMAGHSGGVLAGAVSQAGGLGLFGASGTGGVDWLREQVGIARAATERPFGVGFITHRLEGHLDRFETALDLGLQVIAFSFADPRVYIERCHAAGAKAICQVQSMEHAREAMEAGTDVLAVQGTEAGGHTGTTSLLPLLESVLAEYPDVPVIACGGIATGRGLAAVLAAGADGAWLGTRFLATTEAVEVSEAHKALILRSDAEDTAWNTVFDELNGGGWPAGIGGRSYRNRFLREWEGRERELADRLPQVQQDWQRRQREEGIEAAAMWMGAGAGQITAVETVTDVMASICDEAESLLRRWG